MSWVGMGGELIRIYLEANLLLILSFFLMQAVHRWRLPRRARLAPPVAAAAVSRLARALFVASLVLPPAMRLFPRGEWIQPPVQIWASVSGRAPSFRGPVLELPHLPGLPGESFALGDGDWVSRVALGFGLLILTGLVFHLFRFLHDCLTLHRTLRGLLYLRRLGRVAIGVSDSVEVPFAAWSPLRSGSGVSAYVVLPSSCILRPEGLSLIVKHELQHHRQRDTRWAYPLELARAFFFFNPVIHRWARLMNDCQELACDQALVTRRNVSPQAYGRCLLEAAEHALDSRRRLAGTAGMAAGSRGDQLKRRIEMLFHHRNPKSSPLRRRFAAIGTLFAGAGIFLLMTTAAIASRSAVLDRRVTLAEAQKLAEKAASDSSFPIVVNQAVLKHLNRFLGTPQGRDYVHRAFARLPEYRGLFEDKLGEYDLPEELIAIGLVESAYRNLPKEKHPTQLAAGIWQFVTGTARHFGLRVHSGVDERLNVAKETDAAARYLDSLYLQFQDWGLAIASYNQGERAIERAIDETDERDPWKLYAMGKVSDYLPEVMAAVIILKNPTLID